MSFLRGEETVDDSGQPVPLVALGAQLAPAAWSKRVETRAAVVLGGAPFGADETALLEPQQRGIERALVDLQRVLGHLFQALRDAPPVERAEGFQRAEHHEVEGT